MAVRLNQNKEIVETVKKGLERTGGYCPCKLQRIEENKCMCEEFKRQIADESWHGFCYCSRKTAI